MQHGRHHGPWVGTLFAIGHGLLVTIVAFVFSEVGRAVEVSSTLAELFDWAPTALLLLVAFLNVRQLMSSTQLAQASVKLR
jgi:high-affinity nickel-transport protein